MAKKATREANQFNKITDRLTQKASDGRIGGRETERLTTRFGSGAVSNALAQMGLGNPDLKIGKGVTKYTGLKFFGEGDGRYATYNPSKITRGQMQFLPGMFPNSDYTLGAQNFGVPNWNTMGKSIYGNQWYDTGSGRYRYGGPAGAALPTPGGGGGDTTPGGDGNDYVPTPLDPIEPTEPLQMDDMQRTDPSYLPGGTGSAVDGGALGFRRRKSSARRAGLTTKGTSQFKIQGQNSGSSGLNIGV